MEMTTKEQQAKMREEGRADVAREDHDIVKTVPYEVHRLNWTGIEIEVRYAPEWLALSVTGHSVAHLEIEAVQPERAVLPITETGYRSHFTSQAAVESYGGPLDFAKAWIQAEAASPEWQAREASHRQMSLF